MMRIPVLLALTTAALGAAPPFDPGAPIPAAHGTELRLFAKEPFLKNVVAVCVDEAGRVYATSVVRRKAADLDIREFRDWVETDLSLKSVEDKRRFLRRELVAENSERYAKIGDQNKDGRIDWEDLTVLTDRIVLLEDSDKDGVADKATTFAEGFNTEVTGIAAGLTAWDETVYATVEPDVLRLKDTDGDGQAEARQVLATGFSVRLSYAGHNFSGPVVGPDGRLYVSAADKGLEVVSQEGKTFANPLSGAIARCELDGSGFELFATGLRNVQQPAFDMFGNLFGVDNDGDMKDEKERFVYITEGSDHGWRTNWQYRGEGYNPWLDEGLSVPAHPGQPAYITPPLQAYHDGPCGLVYNPGTALNSFYREHFFMTAFPSGKLYAFKAEPEGAAFKMTGEHQVAAGFLMTGLAFGNEGALYLADWSAKGYELNEKGGVWTLDDPSQATSELREHIAQLLAADWSKPTTENVAKYLDNLDQRVRMKAQFELVRRKDARMLADWFSDREQPLLARLHALWGLGQLGRRGAELSPTPFLSGLAEEDAELRAQTANVTSEIPALADQLAKPLLALLDDPVDRPRFFAAIALGRLGVGSAVEPLIAYLSRDGDDSYHRHAAIMGLAGAATSAQLAALATHESLPVRLAAVVALRRQKAPEVAVFLEDADESVVAEAASAIHDDTSIPAALPALAQLLNDPDQHERTIRRALSAALRLRTPEHAAQVARFATADSVPKPLRLLALELLQQWPQPAVLDSVEGQYRLLPPIAAAEIAPLVRDALAGLLKSSDPELRQAARAAGSTYGLGIDPAELLAIVREDDPASAPDALRLLSTHPDKYAEAGALALKSKHDQIRAEGVRALGATRPEEFPALAKRTFAEGEILDRRAVLETLATLDSEEAGAVLLSALESLQNGTLPPALELDLLEAVRSSKLPAVREALVAHEENARSDDPLAAYAGTLVGGDPARGRFLFNNHLAAQCIRCHAVEGEGSMVGPALGKIGQKEPRYLLESLVDPGKTIAPGYGICSITMKDGGTLTGTLMEESPEALTIRLANESTRRIDRNDVGSQSPPVSSMPPMGLLLTKPELRDLLAYLQSLQ